MVWVLGGGAQSRLNDSGRRGLETTALEEAYQNYRFAASASFQASVPRQSSLNIQNRWFLRS